MSRLLGDLLPAAMTSALFASVAPHVPLAGVVFSAAAVSPLIWAGARLGRWAGFGGAGVAAALLATVEISSAARYLLTAGLVGGSIGASVFRAPASRIGAILALSWVASVACLWLLISFGSTALGVPAASWFHAALLSSRPADPASARLLSAFAAKWPAVTALGLGILCLVGYSLARWLDRFLPEKWRSGLPGLPPFSTWRYPEAFVFVPIFAGLAFLAGRTWETFAGLGRISENLLWISAGAYFLSGLSVFRFLWENSPLLLGLSFAAAVLWPWISASVGVADVWLNFRARRARPEPPSSE